MTWTLRPADADQWPAIEDLFGRTGASDGCWCLYWRIGPAYGKRPRTENKAALEAIVSTETPPGLLAFEGSKPVGWCQVTPRHKLPWLEHRFKGRSDPDIWAISCFYVRRGDRGRGVMSALISVSLKMAKEAGAVSIEAYPVDTTVPGSTRNIFTGTVDAFRRTGFSVVAGQGTARPVMVHDLADVVPVDHWPLLIEQGEGLYHQGGLR